MKEPSAPPEDGAAGDDDGGDVVASGQAFNLVASWLGMTAEAALEELGPPEEGATPQRGQHLGLGAKFVPHSKSLPGLARLDARLRGRLGQSTGRRRRRDSDDEEEEAAPVAAPVRHKHDQPSRAGIKGTGVGSGTGAEAPSGADAAGPSDRPFVAGAGGTRHGEDDEEDGGRASAFAARVEGQARVGGVEARQLLLQADVEDPAAAGRLKKKQKKKRKDREAPLSGAQVLQAR